MFRMLSVCVQGCAVCTVHGAEISPERNPKRNFFRWRRIMAPILATLRLREGNTVLLFVGLGRLLRFQIKYPRVRDTAGRNNIARAYCCRSSQIDHSIIEIGDTRASQLECYAIAHTFPANSRHSARIVFYAPFWSPSSCYF